LEFSFFFRSLWVFLKAEVQSLLFALKSLPLLFYDSNQKAFLYTNKQTVVLRVELVEAIKRTASYESYKHTNCKAHKYKVWKTPNKREREPQRMHRRHIIIVAKQYARQLKPASAQTLSQDIEKI
jgi:hypothetical protein